MTGDHRAPERTRLAVAALLITVAIGLLTELFAGAFPESWRWSRNWPLMGVLLLLLTVLGVWIAARQAGVTTVAALRGIFGRLTCRYEREYRGWISRMGNQLDAVGLVTVGPQPPQLDDVFVHVALTSQPPGHVWPGLVGAEWTGGRLAISDLIEQPERVVLVVLGAPGSGKTTLLRHVARGIARRHRTKRRPTPVLLQLRERAPAIVADPDVDLPALIRSSIPAPVGAEPPDWWDRQLRRGRCVVLLDGLDEVADLEHRRVVANWIDRQVDIHPRNDVVVTSRPQGYSDAFVRTAAVVQVLPFTREQVIKFLYNWYRSAERAADGFRDIPATDERADHAAKHLLGQLQTMPGLSDLTANPLLLTMIAEVHRYGRRRGSGPGLPDNRAALYGEMCEVMLWRRDQERNLPVTLPGVVRLRILGQLAFTWMQRGIRSLGPRELLDILEVWLANAAPGTEASGFLVDMERTGLLLAPDSSEVAFAHHTFQEYLAARYAVDEAQHDVLEAAVDDVWWRETTLLYVDLVQGAPSAIVASALRSGSANALSLAFAIDEANDHLAADLKHQLRDVLSAGMRADADHVHRVIAVDVLLGRHLRSGAATPTGGRVMHKPVSTELYGLFCMATGTPHPDEPGEPEPHEPARGIWRRDAQTFIDWLNDIVASGPRGITFRLPTEQELRAAQRSGLAWAASDGKTTLTVLSGRALTITGQDLTRDLADDLRGSALLRSALGGAAVVQAEALRRDAETIYRDAAQVSEAVRGFARAVEGSLGPAGRNRLSGPARGACAQLLRNAAGMQATAKSLLRILRHMPHRDAQLAMRLGRIVARTDTQRTTGLILAAMQSKADTIGLGLGSAIFLLSDVENTLASVRKLLSRRHATVRYASTQVDRTMALGPTVPLPLSAPSDDKDPAVAFAAALLPSSCRNSSRPVPVELDEVGALLERLAQPSTVRPLTDKGFGKVLNHVLNAARPAVTRARRITRQEGAAVRVPALLLAHQAQRSGGDQLAADLIELAAVISVLLRRAESPDTLEVLYLAHD